MRDTGHLGTGMGCQALLSRVCAIQPRLHVFGHCHEHPGADKHTWDSGKQTIFLNAAVTNQLDPVQCFVAEVHVVVGPD